MIRSVGSSYALLSCSHCPAVECASAMGSPLHRRSPTTDSTTYIHASEPDEPPRKRWYQYLPLLATISLILSPHPSLLLVLVKHHLVTLASPLTFVVHLASTYALTFMIFTSLIICAARDPGPPELPETGLDDDGNGETIGLTDALKYDFDFSAPGMWCRKCWAPKPERTHHCTYCGRCVLKMDHHCPWIGHNCIGHRTYPAFLHFLLCITLFAAYLAVLSANAVLYAFRNPFEVDVTLPMHEIFLFFMGVIFTIVIGSFFVYHLYLTFTNQTTLESLSPFLLLRHLPPLPHSGHKLSDPPMEHELSYQQRRLVKDAHREILLYDIGWKQNAKQALGWTHPYGWLVRLFGGGASPGDGRSFPRNPKSDEMLARLAKELLEVEKDR
ncbi:zf-DHHC-domain-containing protein, partial [Cylindrobasidium torrendii FP15055 ss-10]